MSISPVTSEALEILAGSVRAGRIRRGWTVAELAERVGVSVPTLRKVERGDPNVALGTALEAAVLVGVALFGDDPELRHHHLAARQRELALLPSVVRPRAEVDDDF